jgi:hypothetical protein
VRKKFVPDDPVVEEHGGLQDGYGENKCRWRPASDIKGQCHEIRKNKMKESRREEVDIRELRKHTICIK